MTKEKHSKNKLNDHKPKKAELVESIKFNQYPYSTPILAGRLFITEINNIELKEPLEIWESERKEMIEKCSFDKTFTMFKTKQKFEMLGTEFPINKLLTHKQINIIWRWCNNTNKSIDEFVEEVNNEM